jgi:arylsulfatase
VNDVVPTIYEILGITPPRTVNGVEQDPIDGLSFAYSFDDSKAKGQLLTQYFEIMGSRAIYRDGWMACAFGPRIPWVPGLPPRHSGVDARQGRLGTIQHRRGLEPSQRLGI